MTLNYYRKHTRILPASHSWFDAVGIPGPGYEYLHQVWAYLPMTDHWFRTGSYNRRL